MKMKCKLILSVLCLLALCVCLGACAEASPIERYQDEGMTVTVKYHPNGGDFISGSNVTVIDMFNPSQYEADAAGMVHIKLMAPTDVTRPTSSNESIKLTMDAHFLVGWYTECTVRTNAEGKPVDEEGTVIFEKNGAYYSDEACTIQAVPAYNYSGYWDFETDTVDYKQGGEEPYELNLYAGWVKYFRFEYYVQENGEWVKLEGKDVEFDYNQANDEDSSRSDYDTIWLPTWPEEGGMMEYNHKYKDNSTYRFPKLEGSTFAAAYADPACTEALPAEYLHPGSIDYETCTVSGRIQPVYITYTPGNQYRITKADQLIANPDLKGNYEIMNDLDFAGAGWPALFVYGRFEGTIKATEGKTVTISNVTATYNRTKNNATQFGGLFGYLTSDAVIEGLHFQNVEFKISNLFTPMGTVSTYGLFAGMIDDGAQLDVTLSGATLTVGNYVNVAENQLNLIANGRTDGITVTDKVGLVILGSKRYDGKYDYSTVDPTNIKVYTDLAVVLTSATMTSEQEKYVIDYTPIEYGSAE